MFRRILPRLRALFRGSRLEHEMGEELRFHLEKQIEDNIKAGMTPEEARYATLRTFGGVEQIKERCRDTHRFRFIEDFRQDVCYWLSNAAPKSRLQRRFGVLACLGHRREHRGFRPD